MEYEILIVELSHLTLNQKPQYRRDDLGKHVMGGLVIRTEEIYEDKPDIHSEYEEFVDKNYFRMLDSALLFTDELIKELLTKHLSELILNDEYAYFDLPEYRELLKSFTGVKLLVKEIEVNDWREDPDDEEDKADPDSWEYILKVVEVY